jgi:hypothetical protein
MGFNPPPVRPPSPAPVLDEEDFPDLGPPVRKAKLGPNVSVRTVEIKQRNKITAADEAATSQLVAELKTENPGLAETLEKQVHLDTRPVYTVELCAEPHFSWLTSKKAQAFTDLTDYLAADKLVLQLVESSGLDDTHTIGLDPVSVTPVTGNQRSKFVYQVVSTSKEGLAAIIASPKNAKFKGYTLTFYQTQDSIYGQRFQLKTGALPTPYREWTLAQWTACIQSQGWDMSAVVHIAVGKKITLGKAARLTGLVDIYVKPAAINGGCEGIPAGAGVPIETIPFPPNNIMLGRNPQPISQQLIAQGGLKGQYYSPDTNPMRNALPGIIDSEKGKTFIRAIKIVGRCNHCLGPYHESRNDDCPYNKHCRMCLEYLPALPNKGFHHSCHNLVEDMPKPTYKTLISRPKTSYSTGQPENEAQATYKPSEVFKRQSALVLEAQASVKRQKTERMASQIAFEAEARASGQDQLPLQQNSTLQQQPTRHQPKLPDLQRQLQQQSTLLQEQQYEPPTDDQNTMASDGAMIYDEQDLLNYEDDGL